MIFAITPLGDHIKLATAIAQHFPDDFLQVTPHLYMVSADGLTAKDVSDKLGVTEGGISSVIVFSIAGYFGRAPTNVWEWMAAKSAPRG